MLVVIWSSSGWLLTRTNAAAANGDHQQRDEREDREVGDRRRVVVTVLLGVARPGPDQVVEPRALLPDLLELRLLLRRALRRGGAHAASSPRRAGCAASPLPAEGDGHARRGPGGTEIGSRVERCRCAPGTSAPTPATAASAARWPRRRTSCGTRRCSHTVSRAAASTSAAYGALRVRGHLERTRRRREVVERAEHVVDLGLDHVDGRVVAEARVGPVDHEHVREPVHRRSTRTTSCRRASARPAACRRARGPARA